MRLRRNDDGIALITVVMAMFIMVILVGVSVGLSDHQNNASRVDRKRVFSFHAAEAGIDDALSKLQTLPVNALPCADPFTGTVDAGPGQGRFTVTYQYYETWPASGAPMACPLNPLSGVDPAGVLLTSDGDTTDDIGRGRRLQVAAQLSPVADGGYKHAMFSDQTLEVDNAINVTGNDGNDANIYTNNDYVCDNAGQTYGNVHAQGSITLANGCNVVVDAWAYEELLASGNLQIGRDAKSSTSYVGISGTVGVGRNAIGGTFVCPPSAGSNCGGINPQNPSRVAGATIQQSLQPSPPIQKFPHIPYDESAWIADGYTIRTANGSGVPYANNCAAARDDLRNNAQTWTTPTVVRVTGCLLEFSNDMTVRMAHNVAIISSGGVRFRNTNRFESTNASQERKLYLIVPAAPGSEANPVPESPHACTDATPPNIEMTNSTTIASPVITFMYTPCTLDAANASVLHGQMYGKTVRVANSVNLAYRPMGLIPGAEEIASGFVPSVVYKREVSTTS